MTVDCFGSICLLENRKKMPTAKASREFCSETLYSFDKFVVFKGSFWLEKLVTEKQMVSILRFRLAFPVRGIGGE